MSADHLQADPTIRGVHLDSMLTYIEAAEAIRSVEPSIAKDEVDLVNWLMTMVKSGSGDEELRERNERREKVAFSGRWRTDRCLLAKDVEAALRANRPTFTLFPAQPVQESISAARAGEIDKAFFTTPQIALLFDSLRLPGTGRKRFEDEWRAILKDKPKWAIAALMDPGQKGRAATWDPIKMARAIKREYGVSQTDMRKLFAERVHLLGAWFDEWRSQEA